MENYRKAMHLLEEMLGQGKDNVIALATISETKSKEGGIRPQVRDVDAMYEDGKLYIVTDARSHKVREIDAHKEVSISANFEDFHSYGVARNLGWVLKPENKELREKLMQVFEAWYVPTNNEDDPNTVYLEVALTQGVIRRDHGREFFHIDFESKTALHDK